MTQRLWQSKDDVKNRSKSQLKQLRAIRPTISKILLKTNRIAISNRETPKMVVEVVKTTVVETHKTRVIMAKNSSCSIKLKTVPSHKNMQNREAPSSKTNILTRLRGVDAAEATIDNKLIADNNKIHIKGHQLPHNNRETTIISNRKTMIIDHLDGRTKVIAVNNLNIKEAQIDLPRVIAVVTEMTFSVKLRTETRSTQQRTHLIMKVKLKKAVVHKVNNQKASPIKIEVVAVTVEVVKAEGLIASAAELTTKRISHQEKLATDHSIIGT